MMVESRPPNLLLCLIWSPCQLRRRDHAYPLLKYAAIVVYIGMPIVNYAVASSLADQDQPTHHIPYDGGESTSKPPALPHLVTLPTTATGPRLSTAKVRCNRRLHRYANRKLRSSKLFGRSGPTYTPYHIMVESRPPYLLICPIWAPLRLRRRYHADPLLEYAAIVVYIGMPIANYAVASSLADQDQPTHHTISWWRVDLYTSCFASSGHLFDYSDGTTPIHCESTLQSSFTRVYHAQSRR